MLKLKQKSKKIAGFTLTPRPGVTLRSKGGFTIMELLVTLSIMGILSSIMIANFAGQRIRQKLNIAQNELVTNFRKIQSFALSSRNIQENQPVQYYLIKLDLNRPFEYKIQAMYDVGSQPKLVDVETIKFPEGIRLAQINPITITRSVIPTIYQPSSCALVAFSLPFAKTYISQECSENNWNPNTDDYKKIINFVINTNNYPVSTDSQMVINLTDKDGAVSKSVTVEGVSGLISF